MRDNSIADQVNSGEAAEKQNGREQRSHGVEMSGLSLAHGTAGGRTRKGRAHCVIRCSMY